MSGDSSKKIKICIEKSVKKISREVISRGKRSANALRNAELQVLSGQRSGKVYKKPGTYGKSRSKATRELIGEHGHQLRGGQLYRASAPGEAPARRNGDLRKSFASYTETSPRGGNGITVSAGIRSNTEYADVLERGSARMARRPYREAIIEKARPEIERIFSEPYL